MPSIHYSGNRVDLRFIYDQGLLEELRREVPLPVRHYDSHRNQFSVWEPYIATAVSLFLTYYPDAETFGMPRRETSSEAAGAPQSNASADEDSRYLFVVSDAPEAVYRASYRALVRLYHPDVNGAIGDNRQIQDLNAAWERIRAKKGWT